MDITTAKSAMSQSLLARDVYRVCFTERDSMDTLHDELAAVRKKFFTGGRHAAKPDKSEIVKGFNGRLRGKLSRHGLYWKKTVGKLAIEEAFDRKNGYVVVRRDFRNVIVSRAFFDKEHLWIKSEYYEPNDSINASVMFKPCDSSELIERFDRSADGRHYRATELHPLPYLAGTAEQSIINARFGEPMFVVSTAEGEFCYCSKKEAQARKCALDDIKDGTIVLMPAWEVKDGALAGEPAEEETNVSFTSLEEYAKIAPDNELTAEPESEPSPPPEELPAEEFTVVEETAAEQSAEAEKSEDELILEAARKAAETESNEKADIKKISGNDMVSLGYAGEVVDGRITGRGRTNQQNGLTAYDGEYSDGKREGFGSYYYKDGSLCYAGSWKNDKRDGVGVSFRGSDHALHIAKWENGQPGEMVTLFDNEGNLRYSGRIENGKKQGAGVSVNCEDGTVFVGKWENGEPTGLGSSFDREGNLLYYGGWKDGKRNGHGTEFDGNGGIVFDGEWKDGKYHNGILYQKQPQDGLTDEDTPVFDM